MACLWEETREQRRISKQIEKQLEKDRKKAKMECKMLLLGTSGSGKSTFMKQMRIIHGAGYSHDEKRSFIQPIFRHIIIAIQTLIVAMDTLQVSYDNPTEDQTKTESVMSLNHESVATFKEPYVSFIQSLWSDDGIQEVFDRRREFGLIDNAKYFLSDLVRISAPDYIPTDQDILMVRIPSTALNEYIVEDVDSAGHSFRFVDVGRQRSEARKWIQCFENVKAVLFFVSLSDYDHMPLQGDIESPLERSKTLFRVVIAYPWFQHSHIMLLLNKKDVFGEKLLFSHLATYFPEYDGPPREPFAAREYMHKMFIDLNSDPDGTFIYSFFICATDTDNIRWIFASVRDNILNRNWMSSAYN